MGFTFTGTSGARTRLGWISFAGEVVDEPPRVSSPYRTMDDWVLSYVSAGNGSYRHADGHTCAVAPGTVILIPPRVRHWYGTPGGRPWTETFVVFNGPLFDLLLPRSGSARREGSRRDGPRTPRPEPSVEALRAIVRTSTAGVVDAEHRLLALAGWLLEAARDNDGSGEPSTAIATAARILADDTAVELDMNDVAASVGLSYATFRRRFAAEIGRPPAAHRNEARLAAAASMLKLTDMTLREIARRFGFSDEFHLSRRFKARYGVAPSEYRRLG
ncbi:helix-turn-helix transcriptional regulator [Actinopolymorpha alba]|uniref:helix-turn-helix transcriptional regulator n=1 Tax=Actinopolymorpha alba TaxID=533267 RepID=UPI000375FFC8|nr:AraC family transcriptional regulator [Actinopolymorpha alba]